MALANSLDSTTEQPVRRGVRVCLALPPLFLVSLYGLYLRARLALGVWPRPYHPDPKDLAFYGEHAFLVHGSAIAMLLSPLAFLVVQSFRPFAPRERRVVRRTGAAFAVLYVLTIVFARADPWHVLTWFLD